jgi:hypothetical protein
MASSFDESEERKYGRYTRSLGRFVNRAAEAAYSGTQIRAEVSRASHALQTPRLYGPDRP